MKKHLLLLTGLLSGLLLAACFDSKDFAFDKFATDDIKPTLHLPVLSDTLTIANIGVDDLQFEENGQAYYQFLIDDIEIPSVTDLVKMPDQELADLSAPVTIPPAGGPYTFPTTGFYSYSAELHFGTDAEGIRPDSIVFASLDVLFKNKQALAGGTVYLEVPNLTKNGQIFSKSISATNTNENHFDLAGYSLKINHSSADKNELTLYYRFADVTSNTLVTPGIIVDFDAVDVKEAYGYLGQYNKQISPNTITISDFDNLVGSWNLKEAYLNLDVRNPYVLPIRLSIDQVVSHAADGSVITANNVGTADIKAAAKLGTVTETSAVLGGPDLGPIISVLPKSLDVKMSIHTNPSGAGNNAINDASVTANAKIKVPIKVKNTNIQLTDTLSFDMTDISADDIGIKLFVENFFPIGVTLHCQLLEKETGRNMGDLFNPITIPAASVKSIAADESIADNPVVFNNGNQLIAVSNAMAENLRKSDRIRVYFEAKTPESTSSYMCLTKQNYIRFKIGLQAAISFDDFDF